MRRLFLFSLSLVLVFVLAARVMAVEAETGSGSKLDAQALDAYIQGQMSKHGIKGVSLAVTSKTEIIYLKGFGVSGNGRAMTPQTPMYIGSQSKSFTSLAIAQLIEQGKIDPADPVQKHISWFKVQEEAASQLITIADLLHHTSGLSDAGFTALLPDDATNEEAVRALASAKLTAPVGEKFQYFNLGYAVLSLVVQNVSGMMYEEYIQKNIFDPLEMTRTYTDPAVAREHGLSQGYSRFFGFTIPQAQPHRSFELGDGYLISTAEDLAHYAIAMDNGGMYKGHQLLAYEGMDMLFSPVQGYGMGWFVEQGHVFHGGANETFKTFVDIYPLRDTSIVLLINQGYMFDHYISAPQLFRGVEAIVLGQLPPPVSQGWSVRYMGWALLAFVTGLTIFQIRNMLTLRGWVARTRTWSTGEKVWDTTVSLLIPTIILVAVFGGIKTYFGYRFNWTYQLITMSRTLTDITMLMVIGSIPDYVQGITKVFWIVSGRTSRTNSSKKEKKMNTKTEGTFAIIAALIVLFSAMWDPRVSVGVSIIALLGLGIFKLMNKSN